MSAPQKLKRSTESDLGVRTYNTASLETQIKRAGFQVVSTKQLLGYSVDGTDVKYKLFFCRSLTDVETAPAPEMEAPAAS